MQLSCWDACPAPQSPQFNPVMVTYAYNPSTQEVDTGGSEVQSHSRLHGKFEVSLGSM